MRFSIIIPVYNVEKYIDACMKSVMNQSFRDYEVIVVDDESPDGSMAIVERYAERYPDRLRIIHQKNTRQGGARNHGAALAEGEYLLFVDSDDYVSTEMLETVDRRLRENPCDVLMFCESAVTDDGRIHPAVFPEGFRPGTYIPGEHPEVVTLQVAPWGKAVRREFYQKLGFRFPEKVLYEDGVTRLLYASAEAMVLCEDVLYFYRIRENSTMRQNITPKMRDILTVSDLVLEQFRRESLYETFREPLEMSLIYSILNVLEKINESDRNHPMQREFADYLTENFPQYAENSWVSPELRRELNCLKKHRFRWYYYRFLRFNRWKESLLKYPLLRRLRG